jgi:SpoVK/Ycf46/Vps4 family AAA+-type ATPase
MADDVSDLGVGASDTVEDGPTPAEVYDDTLTIREDPYFSLDRFDGLGNVKTDLQTKVLQRLGMGRYSPASVLLFNADTPTITEYVGKGLTGKLPDTWTTLQVESVESDLDVACNSLEYVFDEATRRAPAIVLLDDVAHTSFENETEVVSTLLEQTRTTEHRVLVVAIVSEYNSEVLGLQDEFDVVVDVPAPDEEFRDWYIFEQLQAAAETGVIDIDESRWTESPSIQKQNLTLTQLKTSVRRTIQRTASNAGAKCPTVTPGDVEDTISIVKSELLEESTGEDILGLGADDNDFDPNVPSITFDDVGGLDAEKRRLRAAVQKPVEYRETFERAGFSVGQGILLHGPPGNGKTMLAKAVANELSYLFFSVKGPEMQNPFVGETERQIRELFAAAREHAPSVIFFDEFDSLAPDRNEQDRSYKEDFVNALLAELDGMDPLEDVIVMAATNRIEKLDDAVTRSGRFDTFIEVTPPDTDDIERIFAIHTTELPTTEAVTPEWFTTLGVDGISGADIATICRKGLEFAVRDYDSGGVTELSVHRQHIVEAVEQTDAITLEVHDETSFH